MEGEWEVVEHVLVLGLIVGTHVVKQCLLVPEVKVVFEMVVDAWRLRDHAYFRSYGLSLLECEQARFPSDGVKDRPELSDVVHGEEAAPQSFARVLELVVAALVLALPEAKATQRCESG